MASREHGEPEPLARWLARRKRQWWLIWRWPLIALIVFSWLPPVWIARDQYLSLMSYYYGFHTSDLLWYSNSAALQWVDAAIAQLVNYLPALQVLGSVAAAVGCGLSLSLPQELVVACAPETLYRETRRATMRAAVYWTGITVMAPLSAAVCVVGLGWLLFGYYAVAISQTGFSLAVIASYWLSLVAILVFLPLHRRRWALVWHLGAFVGCVFVYIVGLLAISPRPLLSVSIFEQMWDDNPSSAAALVYLYYIAPLVVGYYLWRRAMRPPPEFAELIVERR